jgi:hypothetical protein
MEDERPDVLTIGRLAHRTGLPVHPGFRARMRTMLELSTPVPGQSRAPGASI